MEKIRLVNIEALRKGSIIDLSEVEIELTHKLADDKVGDLKHVGIAQWEPVKDYLISKETTIVYLGKDPVYGHLFIRYWDAHGDEYIDIYKGKIK